MKPNTKTFLTILSAALLLSLLPIQTTASTADTEPKIAKKVYYEKQYNGTWKEVLYYQYTYDKNGNLVKSYFRESNETDYAEENRYQAASIIIEDLNLQKNFHTVTKTFDNYTSCITSASNSFNSSSDKDGTQSAISSSDIFPF